MLHWSGPGLGPKRDNNTVGSICCMVLFCNGIQQAWSSAQGSRVIVFYVLADVSLLWQSCCQIQRLKPQTYPPLVFR